MNANEIEAKSVLFSMQVIRAGWCLQSGATCVCVALLVGQFEGDDTMRVSFWLSGCSTGDLAGGLSVQLAAY